MKLSRRGFLRLAMGPAALPALPHIAKLQAYPSRPVHIILGFPPGGSSDVIGRLMAQWLSERLGQPFVFDNRPGAGSNIGTEMVARASPDGYTLLWATSANAINATLYSNLNFDFIHNLRPGCRHLPRPQRPRVQSIGPSEDRSRIHRLRQGQSGQA